MFGFITSLLSWTSIAKLRRVTKKVLSIDQICFPSKGKSLTQDTTLSYIQQKPFQICNLCTRSPIYSTVDSRSRVLKMGGLLIVCRHYKTPLNLLTSIFTFVVGAYFVESSNFFVKWTQVLIDYLSPSSVDVSTSRLKPIQFPWPLHYSSSVISLNKE